MAEMHPETGMLAEAGEVSKDDVHISNADVLEAWLVQQANLLADANLNIENEAERLGKALSLIAWATPALFQKEDEGDLQLFGAAIGAERATMAISDAVARMDQLAQTEAYRGILRSTFLVEGRNPKFRVS